MGLKSFRREEDSAVVTLPNLLTLFRAVGGVIIGILLAWKQIAPITALIWTALLAATDMEGFVIRATKHSPKLQQTLRILPSAFGRAADPIVDKIFTGSIFICGTIGGVIPLWQAVGILAVEAATSITTYYVTTRGGKPETSKTGAFGMVARATTIALDLGGAAASSNPLHNVLVFCGSILAIAAMVLGSISCWKISRTPIKSG